MSNATSNPIHAPRTQHSHEKLKVAPTVATSGENVRETKPPAAKGIRAATRPPSYRMHKGSGQAVVTIDGKDIYLGRYGTPKSKAAYDRIIKEWLGNGRRFSNANPITVAKVIECFWEWAQTHYRRPDGTQTSEVDQCRYALRHLNHLYATTLAADFGPMAFKAVRQLMIDGYEHPKYGRQNPVSRVTAKKWTGIIRRMFRWAVENEMVPSSVWHGLLAVRGLQRGRSTARESEPVRPVTKDFVNAIRPYVARPWKR
jgi:hypothetical protein